MRGERIERLARPRSLGGFVKLKTTAEHLVSLLAAHGVEYLFLNPGTDTAPVQEAVYSLAEAGLPAPTVLPPPSRASRSPPRTRTGT